MEKTAREKNFFRQTHHFSKFCRKITKSHTKKPRRNQEKGRRGQKSETSFTVSSRNCYFCAPKEISLQIRESICDVTITGSFTFVDGIAGVSMDGKTDSIFTLDGRKIEQRQKGVNIIRNGKEVKKVYVK